MLRHLVHPLALYHSPGLPPLVRMASLPPDGITGIPAELREWLAESVAAVERLGFASPVYVRTASGRVDAVAALFERPDGRALSFLHAAEGQHSGKRVTFSVTTAFVDGRLIATSNMSVVLRTPPRPHVEGMAMPGCQDLSAIWRMHDARVRADERRTPIARMTRGDDPIGYEFDDERQLREHWVRRGYYRPQPNGSLRFTRRGATLAAWRGLFPWRHLTQRRHARLAAGVERAFNA